MLTEKIEVRPRYVHVVCGGAIGIEDFLQALNRGLDVAQAVGRKAVLMDARDVDGSLTPVERFVLGDGIAHAQRAHGFVAMVAVVGKPWTS